MLKIDYKGFTAELVSVGKEYSGVLFTKVPEEYSDIPKEYCGGLHRTLQQRLIDMVDLIDYLIIRKKHEKRNMKTTFTFGDSVTINLTQDKEGFYNYTPKNSITPPIQFFSIKDAILFFSELLPVKMYNKEEESLTFVVNIEYKNVGIAFYMSDEDRTKSDWIDKNIFSNYLKVNKEVDDSIDDTIKHFINFVDKEEEDSELNITKFKKHINWKITSDKKEDNSYTRLLTQLDRLAKKDKENNFTPFELRGQLIEIYHLFGKILSLTLKDIHKLYFEKAEG